jgi:HJR/Mrr/RecB family endonuclease
MLKKLICFLGFMMAVGIIANNIIILLLLLLIAILVKAIRYCRHKMEQKAAIQSNLVHEEKLHTTRMEIKKQLYDFVELYTKNWNSWPETLEIAEPDVSAFHVILKNDLKKDFEWGTINILIQREIKEQQQSKFNTSFLSVFYDQYESLTLSDAIYVYCSLFADYKRYLQHMHSFLCAKNLNNDINTLIGLILKTYQKQSTERRVNYIKNAMEKHTALNKKATVDDTNEMDGIEFEKFLKRLFENMGYLVQLTKASGDQGADLILEKRGYKVVVQAKCYSSTVGNSAIQQAFAAKTYYKCQDAIVVTNNYFTSSAQELATTNNVDLFDRDKLSDLLKDYPVILN